MMRPGNFRIYGVFISNSICLLLCVVSAAWGQARGRVHLGDFPAGARVYVNAKPIVAQNGEFTLAPGWYQIQVERQEKGELQAYRRYVQVVADKTVVMPIVWHGVRLAFTSGEGGLYSPPGVSGPSGPEGPPARPYKPLPANADTATLQAPLAEARDILLADFEAQVQDRLQSLGAPAPPLYLYLPGPPSPEPRGDPGPVGPPGAVGLPAEVGLIRNIAGIPMRDRIEQGLDLPAMQKTLAALLARLHALETQPPTGERAREQPFLVLTPAWKTSLDQTWKRLRSGYVEGRHHELGNVVGPAGAPGPRGADRTAPNSAMLVRVSPEQEQQLVERLTTDPTTRARVEALRRQLAELATRVYLAEGEHLDRYPPVR